MMRARGFTLVELVVAIVLSAMIVGFIATLLTSPVDAYVDQSERATMSADAGVVTSQLRADLRKAIPWSVRVRNSGGRSILEMLEAPLVSYYLPAGTQPDSAAIELNLNVAGDTFLLVTTPEERSPRYLVIGDPSLGSDAYDLNATTLVVEEEENFVENDPGEYAVTLPESFSFSTYDLQRRAYWVSTPIAYTCNPTTGAIRRYSGYEIESSVPTSETSPHLSGAEQSLLTENAHGCRFTCDDSPDVGSCTRSIMLRANVTRHDASSEKLAVFEQISLADGP